MAFGVPAVYEVGRRVTNFVGNGKDLTSVAATELAGFVNALAGRRKRILLSDGVEFSQVAGVSGVSRAFFSSFRTGPEVRVVTAQLICMPADNLGTALKPRGHFILQPDPGTPGTSFNQPAFHIGKRKTTTTTPNDLFVLEQRWDGKGGTTLLTANTEYYVVLELNNYARVMAVMIYEEPWSTFQTTPIHGVNPNAYITGAPLLDTPMDRFGDRLLSIWKNGGPPAFSLSRINGTSITTTSTSYVNLLDNSYTAWDANGPGYPVYPYKRGTYESNNVPVQFTIAASDTGSAGSVQFRVSGSTLGTISVTSSAAGTYYFLWANLDATQTRQKVDILGKTTGVNTLSVQYVSCYEYEA